MWETLPQAAALLAIICGAFILGMSEAYRRVNAAQRKAGTMAHTREGYNAHNIAGGASEFETGNGTDPAVGAFLSGHSFGTTLPVAGIRRASCPCGVFGPPRRTQEDAERDSRYHVHMSTIGGLYTADTAATVARLTPDPIDQALAIVNAGRGVPDGR